MKKIIYSLLFLIALFISCKKDDPNAGPAVLLTKILNTGSITLAEFNYNGKQLSNAILYQPDNYSNPSMNSWQRHEFIYDAQGKVSRVNITYSTGYRPTSGQPNGAIFTYDGDNIGSITFTGAENYSNYRTSFSYAGNRVVHSINSGAYATNHTDYSFDNNGNQTSSSTTFIADPIRNGIFKLTNFTFDTKHNIANALPHAVYFKLIRFFLPIFPAWNPGPNNVLTGKYESFDFKDQFSTPVFRYEYNSYDYPSKVTSTGDYYASNYLYEYIKVKQ